MEGSARARRSRTLPRRLRPAPYPLRSCRYEAAAADVSPNKSSPLALERKDWEDATCSVCMEFPHNAVLLLCSSHNKGCRPYMCGTSYRHSNCLDQFKKAYSKTQESSSTVISEHGSSISSQNSELATCPLCRGQVKGWTVVEPARDYLNSKKRSCMQDNCSFTGTYKELQKHVRSEHPCAKPREVDPALEQEWRRLEHEREREDVMSTIRSSMPRSVVFGDYVIEMSNSGPDDSDEDEVVGHDGGISRSILYFFLREGARLMRLQRGPSGANSTAMDVRDNENGVDDVDSSVAAVYSSGDDDDGDDGTASVGEVRRRRRRRRSRGGSDVGPS